MESLYQRQIEQIMRETSRVRGRVATATGFLDSGTACLEIILERTDIDRAPRREAPDVMRVIFSGYIPPVAAGDTLDVYIRKPRTQLTSREQAEMIQAHQIGIGAPEGLVGATYIAKDIAN